MRAFIQARLAKLETWNHPEADPEQLDHDCRATVEAVRDRAIREGFYNVASECCTVSGGIKNARAVLTRCLAVLPEHALTVKEVAQRLGVSASMVYKLVGEQLLPHTRVGRRITVTPAQLEEYRSRSRFRHLTG